MKEFSIEKINKVGKVGRIISKIAMICCIIGVVGSLIGTVALAILPKDSVKAEITGNAVITVDANKIKDKVKIGNVKVGDIEADGTHTFSIEEDEFKIVGSENNDDVYTFTGEASPKKVDIHNFMVITIVAALVMAVYTVNSCFAGKLFKEFEKCESPFTQNIVNRIKMLGYSLIPWVFIGGAVDSAKSAAFSGKLHIGININVEMIIAVLIVLFLAYIFEYGTKLQQESDETL